MQGVVRFDNKGKLNPMYVKPFKVLNCVSPLTYNVDLPHNLAGINDVFHISQLRKCVHDPWHVISYESIDIQANLTYKELPVQVLDRKKQQLMIKTIPFVKVLWQNHNVEEASWKLEQEMRDQYLHLFWVNPGMTTLSYHLQIFI
jgi:hypothetical protein